MMTAIDYTSLMQRVAEGDKAAFHTLARAISPRLHHLAYRLLGYNAVLAEDVVQDCLIKLWRFAPNWKPTGRFEAYANRLVYTSCMDVYRRRKNFAEVPEDIASNDRTDRALIDKEERAMIVSAIDKLPARQRDAVMLYYMQEYSQRQVAGVLGTSEKAIERLLARARTQLRDLIPATIREEG